MSVLLTGSNGLLGANLARVLCAEGERPRLLLRERSDRRGLRGLAYEEVQGDLLDRDSLDQALRGVTEVYHVAGLVRLDAPSKPLLRRVNVEGTRNVLEAARRAGVRRVVHVSSVAAVGYGPLNAPATEASRYNFEGHHPYHESKRDGEAVALAAEGLEVVVVNPTFIVGAYDTRPSSGELLLAVARGLVQLYPSGGNNFVNAQDVAKGMVLAMRHGRPRERYILGGENLTYREFLTQCAQEAGARPPMLPAPELLLRGAGKLGDRLGKLSPAFRNLTSSAIASMFTAAYVVSDKAIRELGYRPQPVRQGIRDAYRWFQEEGVLPRDVPLTPRGTVGA
jgi:dihydroflavonol-4-reductase